MTHWWLYLFYTFAFLVLSTAPLCMTTNRIGPVQQPTRSWWLNDEVGLLPQGGACDNKDLPKTADVVIIGAGITGISTAYWLSHIYQRSSLVLDARGIAGGATGRNGGHLWPNPRSSFEMETTEELLKFVSESEVDCEFTKLGGVSLERKQQQRTPSSKGSVCQDDYEEKDNDDWGNDFDTWDEKTCAQNMHTDAFIGGEYHPSAAQFWPAKVTAALYEASLPHLTLCAPIRVLGLGSSVVGEEKGQQKQQHVVQTDKGNIVANQIIVATNGWTSELLPEMKPYLIPYRNQVLMTRPLKANWTVGAFSVGGNGANEIYGIRRPDGRICVGGARALEQPNAAMNISDDGTLSEVVGTHLRSFLVQSFPRLFDRFDMNDDVVEAEWTGVLGCTTDGKPICGALPSGVFVAAGFNGHGMPRCFGVGKHMAHLIQGNEEMVHPYIQGLNPDRFFQNEM